MKKLILFVMFFLVINSVYAEISEDLMKYRSSLNGIELDARLIYDNDNSLKPIVVVLPTYIGTNANIYSTARRLAENGLFVISMNMRGRGPSQGKPDDSMYELYDIYDAVQAVTANFDNVDPTNVNIIGYSGGGGNVMQAVQKFPDLFKNAYALFGMPNYCDSAEYSWYVDAPNFRSFLEERVGDGSPDLFEKFPNRCLARNALKQIPNNRKTNVQLFVDEEDKTCSSAYSERYAELCTEAGLDNVQAHISAVDSEYRWSHGYADDYPDLIMIEMELVNDIFENRRKDITLDSKGDLRVGGYIKTRRFSIFLGEEIIENETSKGREGLLFVDYELEKGVFSMVDSSYNKPFLEKVTFVFHHVVPFSEVEYSYAGVEEISDVITADEYGNLEVILPFREQGVLSIGITDAVLEKESGTGSYGLYILGACLVLIICIAILYFFRLQKR